LVEWVIASARDGRLPIQTEASPQGTAFYRKLGFQYVDDWNVRTVDPDYEVHLLVMKLNTVSDA
jgi:hypothetical protein